MNTIGNVKVAVLAGGLGTRLRCVLADCPKVLAPVAGKPFLAYLLEHLAGQGLRDVVLCVGYRSAQVEAVFGRSYAGLRVAYSCEQAPLGTAGAVRYRLPEGVATGTISRTDVYGYLLATVMSDGSIGFEFRQLGLDDLRRANGGIHPDALLGWCYSKNVDQRIPKPEACGAGK